MTLNGGSLEYHGGQGAGFAVSAVNVVTSGALADQQEAGGGLLTVGNLATNAAGTSTASFISTYGGLGTGANTADVGHINVNRVNGVVTNDVVTARNGIIGGWATTFSSSANGGDPVTHFATHGPNGVTSVTYNGSSIAGAFATANIRTTTVDTLSTSQSIHALESFDADVLLDAGTTLTLESGGLIFGGGSDSIKERYRCRIPDRRRPRAIPP